MRAKRTVEVEGGRPGLVDGPRTRPAFRRPVASLLVWQPRFAGLCLRVSAVI
jgi:hypothetical protein